MPARRRWVTLIGGSARLEQHGVERIERASQNASGQVRRPAATHRAIALSPPPSTLAKGGSSNRRRHQTPTPGDGIDQATDPPAACCRIAEGDSSQLSSNETDVGCARLRTHRAPRWPSISDDAADDGSRHPYRGRIAVTLVAVRSPPTWRFSPTRSRRCAGAAGPDRRQPPDNARSGWSVQVALNPAHEIGLDRMSCRSGSRAHSPVGING